ncbi:hypothetical protein GCM10010103_38820 [Streptomyces paradoxus]
MGDAQDGEGSFGLVADGAGGLRDVGHSEGFEVRVDPVAYWQLKADNGLVVLAGLVVRSVLS